MKEFLREVWERIQPRLREEAGERAYRSWIEPLCVERMEGGVLQLRAPSRWVAERAHGTFGELLARVAGEEMGAGMHVDVRAAGPPKEAAAPAVREEDAAREPIVDAANRVASLVLDALARGGPPTANGPLVLFGRPGVGKTTLLRWFLRRSKTPMRYYAAPAFARECALAARKRALPAFRASFGGERGLVLDEVHRLKGLARAQEELSLLLEGFAARQCPVVLAARHHPMRIHRLHRSLASRMAGGLLVDLLPPRWESRLEFLRRLERAAGPALPEEAVSDLAGLHQGGYPGLREAWKRLRTLHGEGAMPRGGALRAGVLSCLRPEEDPLEAACARVCARFGLKRQELLGRGRARRLAAPRRLLQYLAVQGGLSAAEVGRRMGGRSRASVGYACRQVVARLGREPELAHLVEELS